MPGRRRRRKYREPWPTDGAGCEAGDRLAVTLGALDARGEIRGEYAGFPVLVEGGIPCELVEVEIIRRFPGHFAARVVSVRDASPDRVLPPCPYFGPCTGCQWQHVAYPRQLEFKRTMVIEALKPVPALAGIAVRDPLPGPETLGYRNHARFTVGRTYGEVGYVNAVTRRFFPVDRCLLMHESINEVLAATQRKAIGMTQFSVRVGVNTGDRLIQPGLPDAVDLESGQTHLAERVLGRRFRIAGSSFFQVNTHQAERMAELVIERLELTGDEVLIDAYAGVGTFAALLAPSARRVIAIEDSPSAVEDARANAEGLGNVEFVRGRTEDVLAGIDEPVDAVILDPPRAGCHPGVLAAVARLAPARVALVSCDLDALARDLSGLLRGPFAVDEIQPVDMFPQTRHVENVALLRRSA